jgi:hypothetical protein
MTGAARDAAAKAGAKRSMKAGNPCQNKPDQEMDQIISDTFEKCRKCQ